jgi:hypothetical protein
VSKDGGEGKERLGKQEALVTSAPRPLTHPPVARAPLPRNPKTPPGTMPPPPKTRLF